ncbi:MAG: rRNA maturation RNase YbeY [Candidatus Shapirobacteria bacterium]|nr:rRNA maturation RNase YbeY [Candidatus Shapirobacteria bacterium]
MTVIDIKTNAGYCFNHANLKKKTSHYLVDQGLEDVEVSLVVVGKRKMRQLNQDYRRLNRVSDVLAFPQKEARTPEGRLILGDVVICYPCAQEEAISYQESIDETIWDFVEHGLNRLIENLE